MTAPREPGRSDEVLLVVDVQNDFCPTGALGVPGGDEIVEPINRLIPRFRHVILTQDWHPPGHLSFASSHPGREPFETIEVSYGLQTLWPDHCVQGTHGSEFHPDLLTTTAELVVRKGLRPEIDSYSAFFENDHRTPTGLSSYLREQGFDRLLLAGLATDFCVYYSAMDAIAEGFQVVVIEDVCRGIDLEGSLAVARSAMAEAGVEFTDSEAVLAAR